MYQFNSLQTKIPKMIWKRSWLFNWLVQRWHILIVFLQTSTQVIIMNHNYHNYHNYHIYHNYHHHNEIGNVKQKLTEKNIRDFWSLLFKYTHRPIYLGTYIEWVSIMSTSASASESLGFLVLTLFLDSLYHHLGTLVLNYDLYVPSPYSCLYQHNTKQLNLFDSNEFWCIDNP